jgi:dTDP-glucose pyrophosphorylase
MKDWQKTLITPQMTLRDALQVIDEATSQIAMVVDKRGRLIGTVTDGDARRGLLRGLTLTDPISKVMHLNPICAHVTDSRHSVIGLMRLKGLHQIPLVDADGVVVGLEVVDDFLVTRTRENWVVIMAGGLGTRLKELTQNTPKPMLPVGSKPLLETIVLDYASQGFRKFYLAVNYKAEQIEDHFGDGSKFGVEIRYLHERERMGTAGGLSLLPEAPDAPFIVTNADLLTNQDFGELVGRHAETGADATMAVRSYEMQVPFGVIQEDNGCIQGIVEKPVQRFTVSAGIYVLSPQVLPLIPQNCFFDMPSLFEEMFRVGMQVRCYSIDGYWLDIGRLDDYKQANADFAKVFE